MNLKHHHDKAAWDLIHRDQDIGLEDQEAPPAPPEPLEAAMAEDDEPVLLPL